MWKCTNTRRISGLSVAILLTPLTLLWLGPLVLGILRLLVPLVLLPIMLIRWLALWRLSWIW